MMAPRRIDKSGRLLNEYLVSLGLLFLLLIPNFAILRSSVNSSFRAATENTALDLARSCMERSIMDLGSVHSKQGVEIDGTTYSQTLRLIPLEGDRAGLTLVVVEVQWSQGRRKHVVHLERYVRGS